VSILSGENVTMSDDPKGYRVRLVEGEVRAEDFAALVAMARAGRIGGATEVCKSGTSDWVRADTIPQVKRVVGADHWAAWGADEAEDVLEEFVEPPLRQALTTPPPPSEPRDAFDELPASAMHPIDQVVERPVTPAAGRPPRPRPPAEPTLPVRRPSGKVIAFPEADRSETEGPHALDRMLRDPSPLPDLHVASSGINWLRVLVVALVCIGGMSLWVWHVNATVKPATLVVAKKSAETVSRLVPVGPVTATPYEKLEDSLRGQLMEGILDIPSGEAFEDALHIELRRLRLDVAWVRVRIESWAGRNQDLPQKVAIQVRLGGRDGELDQDLAAAGLVLGKYIQHYGLETSELRVLIEDEAGAVRQVNMDGQAAGRFFTHRLSLEQFLSAAFRGEK
jgi:hypothetical protein